MPRFPDARRKTDVPASSVERTLVETVDLPPPRETSFASTVARGDALSAIAGDPSGSIDEPSSEIRRASLAASLRSDESVLAEAYALKQSPLRRSLSAAVDGARRATAFVFEDVPSWARLALHPGRRARATSHIARSLSDRLEALPPARRAAVVAAPFALAAVLAVIAYGARERSSDAGVTISPDALKLADVAVPARPAAATPAPLPAPVPDPVPLAPAAEPALAPPAPSPPPTQMQGALRRVPIRSALRVKPDVLAKKAVRMEPGSEVVVYPSFPAPDGWILARVPNGEIGFMVALNLEGKRDPRFAPGAAAAARKVKKPKAVRAASAKPRRARTRLLPMPL